MGAGAVLALGEGVHPACEGHLPAGSHDRLTARESEHRGVVIHQIRCYCYCYC